MAARTRSTNIAIFTRACWLAGFSLGRVIRSCERAGATRDELASVVRIYVAADNAMATCGIAERGADLDRRAS